MLIDDVTACGYGIWQGPSEGRRKKGTGRIQRVKMRDGTRTLRVVYLALRSLDPDHDDEYDEYRRGRQYTRREEVVGWRQIQTDGPLAEADERLVRAWLVADLTHAVEIAQLPPDDDRDAPRLAAEREMLAQLLARVRT